MAVRIVTDSTSDLPGDVVERLGITVVAQNVHFGTETYKDNVTITPDTFFSMLASSKELPKTSQASPGEFKEVYDQVGDGADGIVSIHVAAKLSGTYNSAVQARELTTAQCPVEVIDTAQASMGEGLVVIAAAEAANAGASMDEVAAVARNAAGRSHCMALLETLEYLQKGGRIGKAQAMLGSILQIKPMILVRDGEVHELGKARTFREGVGEAEGDSAIHGARRLIGHHSQHYSGRGAGIRGQPRRDAAVGGEPVHHQVRASPWSSHWPGGDRRGAAAVASVVPNPKTCPF